MLQFSANYCIYSDHIALRLHSMDSLNTTTYQF